MKKICTIGGGTGNFVLLSGLKRYQNVDLSAIVSMADDGGSTGVLRDELGVLPSGDARQCVVALSNSSCLMRDLMNYRFDNGGLKGHSFGNLFLSALEKVTGSFEKAIEEIGKILNICGNVIPVTMQQVRLNMLLENDKLLAGEREVYLSEEIDQGYKKIYLDPQPKAHQHAVESIYAADAVILGPGGIYTSLIANLLVKDIAKAICETKAKKIFVVNLMNRKGQTTGYKVSDYVREVSQFLGKDIFDAIVVNDQKPDKKLMTAYIDEGEFVENDLFQDKRVYLAKMLGKPQMPSVQDPLKRSLIRHDSERLAQQIMRIITQKVKKPCLSSSI